MKDKVNDLFSEEISDVFSDFALTLMPPKVFTLNSVAISEEEEVEQIRKKTDQ